MGIHCPSGGVHWAVAANSTGTHPQTIAPTGTTLEWFNFFTDDRTWFQTENNAPGDTQVILQRESYGIFLLKLYTQSGSDTFRGVIIAGLDSLAELQVKAPTTVINAQEAMAIGYSGGQGLAFDVSLAVNAAGPGTLDSAIFQVFFWPTGSTYSFDQVF